MNAEPRISGCKIVFDGVEITSCEVAFDSSGDLTVCVPSDIAEEIANKLKTLPDGSHGTFEMTVSKQGFFTMTFSTCASMGTEREDQSERVQVFTGGPSRYLLCTRIQFLTR